jgi:hypothetical protein
MTAATKKGTATRTANKSTGKRKPSSSQHCWPGFEPTRGKAAGEKGSCKPKPDRKKKSVRRADKKAAAANKLQKTNPR